MNHPNFHDMVHSARCEGYREGRDKGWREAKAVYEHDKKAASVKVAARGFIAGFSICAFVAMFWLLFFGLFTL